MDMYEYVSTTEQDVLSFRMHSHNLSVRLPVEKLLSVIGACGLRNPSPQSVSVSLAARLKDFSHRTIENLMERDKTLVQTLSTRGAIRCFALDDFGIFTHALVPQSEDELRYLITGAEPALTSMGLDAMHLFRLVENSIEAVLSQRTLTRDELGRTLAFEVEKHLTAAQTEVWRWPSDYAPGQSLGESLTRFLLSVVALTGKFLLMPKAGIHGRPYALASDFLGPKAESFQNPHDEGRSVELVKRYLHCYGPATVEDFAAWTGVSFNHAQRLWASVWPFLEKVSYNTVIGWMLLEDVATLGQHPFPEGVRFIPSYDPWLRQHDRSLLVQGKHAHQYFWKSAGSPGMVLFDGICVAGWRMRRNKNRLSVVIEDIGLEIGRVSGPELEAEATLLAESLNLIPQGYVINTV
jgi:hypothetical protein